MPCVVKPIMSSSGHGQSVIRSPADIDRAWHGTPRKAGAGAGRVIVGGFLFNFDYEISPAHRAPHGWLTTFLEPIGHRQVDGDYRESWQPTSHEREGTEICTRDCRHE